MAALAGAALWLAGSAATGRFQAAALPAVSLHPLDGGAPVALRQVAPGRPLVVNLWASWCGPCRAEMPVLAEAQRRSDGVAFAFVNQGEVAAAVHAYLQQERLALRGVLLDPTSSLGRAVGSHGLPTTLFYDAEGRLAHAHFGVLNGAALAGRLQELQATPSRP
jgi:thiol-disulfide isomerase/thioredoxin